jgi:Lar family restriction alleviation protein
MTDLKPCPFCGGKAEDGYYDAYSADSSFDYIGCTDCKAMIEYDDRGHARAEAIVAWNTRYKPKAEELFDQQIAEYVKRGKP